MQKKFKIKCKSANCINCSPCFCAFFLLRFVLRSAPADDLLRDLRGISFRPGSRRWSCSCSCSRSDDLAARLSLAVLVCSGRVLLWCAPVGDMAADQRRGWVLRPLPTNKKTNLQKPLDIYINLCYTKCNSKIQN
jgi:hypothetical protein